VVPDGCRCTHHTLPLRTIPSPHSHQPSLLPGLLLLLLLLLLLFF
jgi:hypothetical protein